MRRFTILFFITLAAAFIGCNRELDIDPTDQMSKNAVLSDVEGMQVAMDGVYAAMYHKIDFVSANMHQCFGNMAVILAADLMGEDMVHTAQGPGWFWKDYTYEMRSRYTSTIWRSYFTWKYFYSIISNCNYIIASADDATGDENEKGYVLGQAYATRAYSYFMLIQSFQQTYKGHEQSPGVPVYTEPTTSASKGKGRGTVAEVYSQIDSDLNEALVLFEESGVGQKHVSHLDFYSTSLLKARVALVENDWQTAADAAADALKKPGKTLLSLSEAAVIKGTFDDETSEWTTGSTTFNSVDSPNVLWGAQILSEQSNVFASFFSMMDACTDVYYATESPKCISNWLYSQIPDTDVRKGWWNGNIGIPKSKWHYGANINYNQFKFQWKNQKSHTGDYIFMRLEEAVLIRAEALCRLGDDEGAKAALAELESRRNPNYESRIASLTGFEQTFSSVGEVSTLLDEILLQRRIELWGEVGRIYDILRLGKGWTRTWSVGGEESNHTDRLTKYADHLNFPADYLECIMMIPQAEIDNNPNIGPEDQNPFVQ
jgi:hypothetical protein